MRVHILSLLLIAAACACAPAAPAPLARRVAADPVAEVGAMQNELVRVNQELGGQQVQLLAVRRGEAANEWVVTYTPSVAALCRKCCEPPVHEVKLVAAKPEQFADALRGQFVPVELELGFRVIRCK